jgi:Ca-activated chloride channel family protein
MMSRQPMLCVALLLSVGPLGADRQNPTFSSKVEAVRIDVLVSERGVPVRGLGPDDFEVFDNGIPQRVDLVAFEQLPLNIVLTLDMSASVVGQGLEQLRAAGRGMLSGLKKGDQAALVVFSHQVAIRAGLTADFARVRAALDRAQPFGTTSVIDATYTAMMIAESDVGRSLVMVFSDGLDTGSWLAAERVIEIARRSDAVIYGVSAVMSAKDDFLRDAAAQTGGRVIEMDSTGNLTTTFVSILDEFRQRYVVSYSPAGVSKDGWHTLQVRVKGRSVPVKARPGYFAGL